MTLSETGSAEFNGPERNGVVQPGATSQEIYDGGMKVRREVLGAAHVDRANANKLLTRTRTVRGGERLRRRRRHQHR